ncbi:2-amino-4-hydroxy-6-hydroxymethyldihydropteridine diphosphokinase [Cumulibacter manganitolerans]|uniref:2-amino-4-hydroxy-6- hydroxymethyldihydropteridine diphosphokinase n=1 Tax=Cumulibacter manganitolerans TaxID=1884992 RepID=UPI0012971099|nr:2-amino-4-hydroxy-6-hydroxymethyldihydropteridine diphosphokinase [Cumulibacter manganitolerans]
MTIAVLSIGSNVGDSIAHLRSVVDRLGDRLVVASGVYRTAPWGGVEQEPFHNAVLIADDDALEAGGWLGVARACESAAGRTRKVRWGPRTLDVDVIAVYDREGMLIVSGDPELTLPHPRAHERAFVLAPWVELQPHAMLPQGAVDALLRGLLESGDPQQQVERLDGVAL